MTKSADKSVMPCRDAPPRSYQPLVTPREYSMVTDTFGLGVETAFRLDKLASLAQKLDQRHGIHISCTTGMEARIATKTGLDRLLQALAGKTATQFQHHLHHFVAVD